MNKNKELTEIIKNLKEGDLMMCANYTNGMWKVKYYQETGKYGIYVRNTINATEHRVAYGYTYIIPLKYFNPNDIEGSVKNYNIQTYE